MIIRKPTTLNDVARRAGVSKMAVSVVVNGARSGTHVSQETRQRILTAAEELDYRPNAIARSLVRRRSDIIGFYNGFGYVNVRTLFLAEVMAGLQEGCEGYRKDLLIHGVFRGNSADDIYAELSNGKIDGLVLYAPSDDPLIPRLAAASLPVVAIADAIPSIPSVVTDDTRGAHLLAEHLAKRGHRRALYVLTQNGFTHKGTSGERRRVAFHEAARACGMTTVEGDLADYQAHLGGANKKVPWGSNEEHFTAAFCWSDGQAYHLLAKARRLGLRIPQDLAIVGFDGTCSEVVPSHRLTTIHASWAEVARTAVSLVAARIEGKEVPQETVLPVRLVEGETT